VDNVVRGPTQWSEAALGASGNNLGEGIALTGPGNVIAFNRVVGFRDCISLLEDGEAVNQVSFDIYGNDLDQCADDAIEADFAMGNVRVFHNRIANSFMGISSQPSLGGPTYFLRNVMFNIVAQGFKLQRSSVGDVGFHNTVIKTGDAFGVNTSDVWSQALFRNNIFIGGPGGTYNGYNNGTGRVMHLPTADATCHFDFDGYGSIGTGMFSGDVNGVSFDGLAQMQALTTEANAVQLELDAFSESISLPSDPVAVASAPVLTLADGGAAIDRGTPLANINDGFGAAAPDLGAYELGQPIPVYGPGGTLGGGGVGAGGGGGAGGDMDGNGGGVGDGGAGSGANGATDGAGDDDGGCGCRTAGGDTGRSPLGLALLALALAMSARRRELC
jgi:MYXO-CTERM domain-containing protein